MTEGHYKILLITVLILLGTVLGILMLFSHTIMPGLRKVGDETFVRSFQAIDKQIINPIFMFQYFAPLFILGAIAYYAHKHHLIEAKYIYVAFVCYLLTIIITISVNVPLNEGIQKVASTNSHDVLSAGREQFNESKWALFNNFRTFLTLISTGCTAAAVWVSKVL